MFRKVRGVACAALLTGALSIGLSTAAPAQEQFPEDKLGSFVEAAIQVEQLVAEWSPKIEGAADEDAANQLREEANADLAAAIEETDGITVEEYRTIAQAAQSDPALSTRLREIYEQKSGS
jgi:hypothetical protein